MCVVDWRFSCTLVSLGSDGQLHPPTTLLPDKQPKFLLNWWLRSHYRGRGQAESSAVAIETDRQPSGVTAMQTVLEDATPDRDRPSCYNEVQSVNCIIKIYIYFILQNMCI
jgi:hypothetical protein